MSLKLEKPEIECIVDSEKYSKGCHKMDRFDSRGAIIIPNPFIFNRSNAKKVLRFTELYCSKGHQLVSSRVKFNGYDGVLIKVSQNGKEGIVALSPIYGDKSKISVDIDLVSGERAKMMCPVCGEELPVYSECHCGGEMIALFRSKAADYSECVAVCDKVDCVNAHIIHGGQLVTLQNPD